MLFTRILLMTQNENKAYICPYTKSKNTLLHDAACIVILSIATDYWHRQNGTYLLTNANWLLFRPHDVAKRRRWSAAFVEKWERDLNSRYVHIVTVYLWRIYGCCRMSIYRNSSLVDVRRRTCARAGSCTCQDHVLCASQSIDVREFGNRSQFGFLIAH
jgi:hypothetical protein